MIAPTILELAGVETSGCSLASWVLNGQRPSERAPILSTSDHEVSLTTADWKVVLPWDGEKFTLNEGEGGTVYRRTPDLEEAVDVGDTPPQEIVALMTELVERFRQCLTVREAHSASRGQPDVNLSDRERELMRGIGYADE